MNPILLKPTSDVGSQVILMGRPVGNMKAMDYYRKKKDYIPLIMEAYGKLAADNDYVIIEGAGSPVEINLRENDIVNMGLADLTDASVLLVGDIDRGGVFAQLLGTMELLSSKERDRVNGLIINKFRGDVDILRPGLKMIEDRCDKPVLGVVPYTDIKIEDEDSLAGDLLIGTRKAPAVRTIDIAVIRLKWIGNFTDLDPFKTDPDVSVRYVDNPDDLGTPDMVVIPGSKNTTGETAFLKETGLAGSLKGLAAEGVPIIGICGGYQLMGMTIDDKAGIEGGGMAEGLGLLPVDTVFYDDKITRQVKGRMGTLPGPFKSLSGLEVFGYELHMGRTLLRDGGIPLLSTVMKADEAGGDLILPDGCVQGNCIGTYLHGIFDDTAFRDALIRSLYKLKGLPDRPMSSVSYKEYKEKAYDSLADLLKKNLDIERIFNPS
jgi:adenosylcobyric acid synthase